MENLTTANDIIKMFKKKQITTFYDVPEDLLNNKKIITLQRQHGHRVSKLRGYDVINNEFFVEEDVAVRKSEDGYIYDCRKTTFQSFDEYYDFLDGDIYENACYYQFTFTDEIIGKYNILLENLKFSFVSESSINDIRSKLDKEKETYLESKQNLKTRKNWIKKFNEATTYDKFIKVVHKYEENHHYYEMKFYIWNYISKNGIQSFDIIIKFLSENRLYDENLIYAICFIFGAEKVEASFKYKGLAESTNSKHNAKFKRIANRFKNNVFSKISKSSFDINTGFYCTETTIYEETDGESIKVTTLYNYFETIDELGEFLNYDFSGCDFTYAFDLQEEKILKFDENTLFPVKSEGQLTKKISIGYSRNSKTFFAQADFITKQGKDYCKTTERFDYFFQFISYMNYDLSNANLIFCDGLKNISNFSNLNLENARIVSSVKTKIGALSEAQIIKIEAPKEESLENNETETALILQSSRDDLASTEEQINDDKIYYITDLHLEHRLIHANCKTKEDNIYIVQKIIDNLLADIKYEFGKKELLLIGGDIASSFKLFKLFVVLLKSTIKDKRLNLKVIFTLGNHELWEFSENDIDTIVNKYRLLLEENGMYLLHNEMLCVLDEGIKSVSLDDDISKIREARAILFGGIGFSGCNNAFNANNGIYEITREQYCDFYRGKNIGCTCNCANKIYMLKKNGYYCFIHENNSKILSMMNGGSKRTLKIKDINYYYENMDTVVNMLATPLKQYTNAQIQISNMIKKIGGDGTIHGAIIDINFFNHVFLNPLDHSVTTYYAEDIIYKEVYPSFEKLLECKCPKLYKNYKSLLNSGENSLVLKENAKSKQAKTVYLSTDIYSASREIKKMQKLNANILTIWLDGADDNQYDIQASNLKKLN